MITGPLLGQVLAKQDKRLTKLRIKYGPAERKPKFWNIHTLYLFCAWVAFAGALTGLAFVGAVIFDSYRATREVHEVWTQTAQGQIIPMKERGK